MYDYNSHFNWYVILCQLPVGIRHRIAFYERLESCSKGEGLDETPTEVVWDEGLHARRSQFSSREHGSRHVEKECSAVCGRKLFILK